MASAARRSSVAGRAGVLTLFAVPQPCRWLAVGVRPRGDGGMVEWVVGVEAGRTAGRFPWNPPPSVLLQRPKRSPPTACAARLIVEVHARAAAGGDAARRAAHQVEG